MTEAPLAEARFFLVGEEPGVASALVAYLRERGAETQVIARLEELDLNEETENVLVAHYSGTAGLAHRLPILKRHDSALKVVLLHEITERGQIDTALLSVTDHLLEKPFTRQALEKALAGLKFHPLSGKSVYLFESGDRLAGRVLRTLGASVVTEAGTIDTKTPPELAVMAPEAIDDTFRVALAVFRQFCPDVPIFMLYDPQAAGTLDSDILKEVAYLVQKPVTRPVLRQKLLAYFEQPLKDRRKNPRKKGISQMWISAFNTELGTPELFESPYLIDISQSGLSFQSHIRYNEGQLMAIWIVAEDYPDKIIDLRGNIRWKKHDGEPASFFKYGLEFTRQDSDAYRTFARMIAMH
ncbi:MAG: PilZ domain-containing protein [Turneriella sp.]